MLPKFKFFAVSIVIITFVTVALLLLNKVGEVNATCQPVPPFPPPAPQILEPNQCDQVSGAKVTIIVEDPFTMSIDLDLYAEGFFFPCYVIARNLLPKSPGVFEYAWDSTQVVDFDNYRLVVRARHSTTEQFVNMIAIGTNNSKTGALCEPPDEPSNGGKSPPPSNGDGESPPPSSEDGSQSSQSTTGQSSSSQQSSQSTGDSDKDKGEVEEVIIEEEIPIKISAFDPDIFLKGSSVSIKEIKNVTKEGQAFLRFTGETKPNTLVTLYVFSNPVIVVVKSDQSGNWVYDREKDFDSGKHTAFATIYDEKVTRRSDTVDFFIVKSAREGSVILQRSNLERFYPYAISLAVAFGVALLILFMYRIYSKQKQEQINV
ncbi:hypothetical protein IH981_00760 [Patescibacteria group bacterium]|nr:hypothetical protein [Patescibacteria group bacterium]